jgi:hypothetical protein
MMSSSFFFSILIDEQSIVKWKDFYDWKTVMRKYLSLWCLYRHFIYKERQRSIFHLFSTLLSFLYLKSQLNCRFRFIHGHRCAVLHPVKLSIVNEANVKVINLMRLRSISKRGENQINNIKKRKKKEKEKVHFLPFGWTVHERESEPARMYT